MKKLIKPKNSIENLSEEVIEAFCDHGIGCPSNCQDYCSVVAGEYGTSYDKCVSIHSADLDDDILF